MNRLFMLEKNKSESKFAESAVKLFDFLLVSNVIIFFVSLPFFSSAFVLSSPFFSWFVSFGCSNHATVMSFLTFNEIQTNSLSLSLYPPFKTKSWRLLFTFRL